MLHVFPFVARIMKGMGQLEACNQLPLKDYVGSLLSGVLMNGQHFCNRKRRKMREKKRFNTFEEKIIKMLVSLYAVLDIYHQFSTHDIRYKSTEHHGRRIFQDLTALCFQW